MGKPKGITKEVMLLRRNANTSLIAGLEQLSHPERRRRSGTVLLLLHHALSMLLMAAISHRRHDKDDHIFHDVKTRELKRVHRLVKSVQGGGGRTPILRHEQLITFRFLYELRNLAEHHLLFITEPQLRVFAYLSATLFKEVDDARFRGRNIRQLPRSVKFPARMTTKDWKNCFREEVTNIRSEARVARGIRAYEINSRIRTLIILDEAVGNSDPSRAKSAPSIDTVLQTKDVIKTRKMAKKRYSSKYWDNIFLDLGRAEIQEDGGIFLPGRKAPASSKKAPASPKASTSPKQGAGTAASKKRSGANRPVRKEPKRKERPKAQPGARTPEHGSEGSSARETGGSEAKSSAQPRTEERPEQRRRGQEEAPREEQGDEQEGASVPLNAGEQQLLLPLPRPPAPPSSGRPAGRAP